MHSSRRALSVAVAIGALGSAGASAAHAETPVEEPASFTSMYSVNANPDTIINTDGDSVPGEAGAQGMFNFRINSDLDIICYDLKTTATPPYMSPAKTATHVHEAADGTSGPPRIAFPNPSGESPMLMTSGCLQGPFTTGILVDGVDTGDGFTLKQIEADPEKFAADVHTEAFPAGAVRGQLSTMPLGGVATGGGGTATPAADTSENVGALAAVSGLSLLGAGLVVAQRRRNRIKG